MWQAGELLDRLDDLQEDVARADFADDVSGARRAIDAHADINKRLAKVPVDELEAQGIQHLASYRGGGGLVKRSACNIIFTFCVHRWQRIKMIIIACRYL